MQGRLIRFLDELSKKREVSPLVRFAGHIRALSPGDQFITGLLAGLIALASVGSLVALMGSLQIQVPTQGGTLTEGVLGSPRFVNPLLALSDADRDLSALTYAGLMGKGPGGTLVPVLAERYDISEDGREYTFILRENARFSDDTPVTADDIVFTILKAQDPELKSPEFANWASIRVEALDARTVHFSLPKPYAPFLEDATLGILPAHLWRSITNEEFPFSPLMSEPVGAGPFVVEKVVRSSSGVIEAYELKAFPKFALGRAYLDKIVFRFFSQETDLQSALTSGKVMSAYGIASEGALRSPYARVFGVFFNADQNPVYARIEVRKALSIATDRQHITENVLGGFAKPIWGPVPPGTLPPGGETVLENPGTREERITVAGDVLRRNGWEFDEEGGSWTNEKEGLSLSVTLKTSNVPELKAVATAIKNDWEALGVPVSLELYEPGDLSQNVIRPRSYEALLFGMVVGHDRDLYAFWSSSERHDPGLNIALYANRTVDELLAKIREEADPVSQQADLMKIDRLVAEEYPAVFTHAPDFVYAIPDTFRGIELPQISSPSDRFAGVWQWYRYTELIWPFLKKLSE